MDWVPNLAIFALKPLLTSWIISGLEHLRTDEMKATIVKTFQNDGCMTEIRSPARRILYLEDEMTALQLRMNATTISVAYLIWGQSGGELDLGIVVPSYLMTRCQSTAPYTSEICHRYIYYNIAICSLQK